MKRSSTVPKVRQAVGQSKVPAETESSREAITRRAYELYVARGRTDGHDLNDWLQAERECRGRSNRSHR